MVLLVKGQILNICKQSRFWVRTPWIKKIILLFQIVICNMYILQMEDNPATFRGWIQRSSTIITNKQQVSKKKLPWKCIFIYLVLKGFYHSIWLILQCILVMHILKKKEKNLYSFFNKCFKLIVWVQRDIYVISAWDKVEM